MNESSAPTAYEIVLMLLIDFGPLSAEELREGGGCEPNAIKGALWRAMAAKEVASFKPDGSARKVYWFCWRG